MEALDTFGSAVRNLHAAGNLVDELDATVVLADLWLASGRPSRARKLYEQALQKATASGEPFPRATADLHVGLAELDRELDDLASAEAHLESARVLGERASITENRHRWYAAMALLRAATGNYAAALHLLDEAEALYRRGFYPDVRPLAAMKARLQIAAGDLASAAEWAHERSVSVTDVPEYLHEYEHLTLVRLLIAAHRTGHTIEHPGSDSPVAAALDLLDKLHAAAAAADAGRDGSLLEIRVLQALAHHANGDVPRALVTVERAVVEAPEPERYVRLYLDEGAPMHALLHEVATERGDSTPVHVRRLLERAATPAAGFERQQPLVDPLSQRELEVLRLLDSELSGPELARQLYVSLNTLRTHTKRIFTKLDVTNRAAAVRRGRELGLL